MKLQSCAAPDCSSSLLPPSRRSPVAQDAASRREEGRSLRRLPWPERQLDPAAVSDPGGPDVALHLPAAQGLQGGPAQRPADGRRAQGPLARRTCSTLPRTSPRRSRVRPRSSPTPRVRPRGKTKADETLCTMCHLGGFMGQNEIPRVAGQHYDYVVKQLQRLQDRQAHQRRRQHGQRLEDAERPGHRGPRPLPGRAVLMAVTGRPPAPIRCRPSS